MGYSRLEYPYTGGAQDFTATFALGTLNLTDVTVYVQGEVDGNGDQIYRAFTWPAAETVRITDPLPNPCTVVIDRTVNKDELEINLDESGSVTRVTLVRAFKHLMMNVHELLDGRIDSFTGRILDLVKGYRDDALAAETGALAAEASAESSASLAQAHRDRAQEWAEKTDGYVLGPFPPQYSAKYWATHPDVQVIVTDKAGLDTIGTTAGNIANVNTVAVIDSEITTLAGMASTLTAVEANATNINTVAANASKVTAVADDITKVNYLHADLTGVSSKITVVYDDLVGPNTVGQVQAALANINSVASVIPSIDTVASISGQVTSVSLNNTDISTVAASISAVNVVAGIDAAVNTVSSINTNVTTVAGISAAVQTVFGIQSDVQAVAANQANINTVALHDASITDAAGALTDVHTSLLQIATAVTDTNTRFVEHHAFA